MRTFLKNILKKNTTFGVVVEAPGNFPKFVITNPQIESNNGCETIFTGSYFIPTGTTATVTGTMTSGFGGGGGSFPSGVTNNVQPGAYQYSVNLGNSNSAGNASSYVINIQLSDNRSLSKLIQRTVFQSAFYDKEPC